MGHEDEMASLDHGERWGGEHHVAYLDDADRVGRLACVGYGAC